MVFQLAKFHDDRRGKKTEFFAQAVADVVYVGDVHGGIGFDDELEHRRIEAELIDSEDLRMPDASILGGEAAASDAFQKFHQRFLRHNYLAALPGLLDQRINLVDAIATLRADEDDRSEIKMRE